MREKYESLSLATLKELAKARGLKGVSALRKPELVQRMLEEDEKESSLQNENTPKGREEVKKESRPETKPEVRSESRPETKPEVRSESRPETKPEVRSESRPETKQEVRSESRPEMKQEVRSESRPEIKSEGKGEAAQLDSGEKANGILEVLPDGYGFIRCENYLPGDNDIYVSPSQIRRFNLKTGDIIQGNIRIKTQGEKFSALLYVTSLNGLHPSEGPEKI